MSLTVAEIRTLFTADTSGIDKGQARVRADASRTGQTLSRTYAQSGEQAGRAYSSGLGRATSGTARRLASLASFGVPAALATGLVKSITLAKNFDLTIRQVGVQTGQTADQMKSLSKLALKMGADTSFSAQDAGDAMLELAKGGMTAAQIKAGALKTTMVLAAAGGVQMGDAAGYVVQGMTTFGLKVSQANQVAVALAGGANASTASVQSLGEALSQVGPGAKTVGLSLQETVGALAAFDNAGIKGSDAGTSLKTMLASLVPTTKTAQKAMDEYHLSFVNQNGSFKSLAEISEELKTKLGGLTAAQKSQALTQIFGSDATRAASVLMGLGAKGINKYVAATRNQKTVQDMANVSMKGAAGAWNNFTGAAETAGIKLGTVLLPKVTKALNWFSKTGIPDIEKGAKKMASVARWFDDLPGPIKGAAKEVALFAGGTAVALTAARKLAKVYEGLKGGASVLKGLGGGGSGGSGGGLGGVVASSKPVPVYVTNKGFGGPGGGSDILPGSPGEKPGGAPKPKGILGKGIGALGFLAGLAPGLMVAGGGGMHVIPGKGLPKGYRKSGESNQDAVQRYADETNARLKAEAATRKQATAQGWLNGLLVDPALGNYSKQLAGLPKKVQTLVNTPGAVDSKADVEKLRKQFDLTPKQVKTLMHLIGADKSRKDAQGLKKDIDKVPGSKASKISTPGAAGSRDLVGNLLHAIGLLKDKTITIRTVRQTSYQTKRAGQPLPGQPSAYGNFFRAYAAGGFDTANGHQPEIARPGAVPRVWAEEETGGESYIPHRNDARRPRAKSILEKTARLFGGNVQWNAQGNMSTVPAASFTQAAAAWQIAQASLATLKNARATTDAHLADLQAQQQIRDINRDLDKMEGKKGHRHHALRGLDREIAQAQLVQAKEQAATAKATPGFGDKGQTAHDQITSMAGVFGTGTTSAKQLLKNFQTDETTNAQWAGLLAKLKTSGLSKGLLDQFTANGPSAQALALGKSILSTGNIKDLNKAQATIGAQADQLGYFADGKKAPGSGKNGSPLVAIDKFYAGGMSPDEIAEKLYFKAQVRG